VAEETGWLGTKDASARLGITLRSLYRFIDEGDLPAYKFGRVIRMKVEDIDSFIESRRIQPGQLEHLYPALKGAEAGAEAGDEVGGDTGGADDTDHDHRHLEGGRTERAERDLTSD
jgi:excisionase family DNA binding protein